MVAGSSCLTASRRRLCICKSSLRLRADRADLGRPALRSAARPPAASSPRSLKSLVEIEIFRLKIDRHLSVRRKERPLAPEIAPDERERGVGAGVFRRPLVDLDLADLERRILRLQDGLENQLVAPEINDRDLQFLRRVMRLDLGLQILQIGVTAFFQFKVEVAVILRRWRPPPARSNSRLTNQQAASSFPRL